MVDFYITPCQTPTQAAASLMSALRARGASATRSLELNFVVWAGTVKEMTATTVALWRAAVVVCPLADDLTACIAHRGLSGLPGALPG